MVKGSVFGVNVGSQPVIGCWGVEMLVMLDWSCTTNELSGMLGCARLQPSNF